MGTYLYRTEKGEWIVKDDVKRYEHHTRKITTMPQEEFDNLMREYELNDENIEQQVGMALISIICSRVSYGYMVDKHGLGEKHYFNENHSNVLNLDFDDIEADETYADGTTCKAFSSQDADKVIHFIEANVNKEFIIHCFAGVSRSGAIAQFMRDYYPWVNKSFFDIEVKPGIRPNAKVLSELKKTMERHKNQRLNFS
ncbi:hypothetical protein FACS1894199_08490 [Bacteroidia bacterium]|nr:hypothetical protein FACS1894199_08490 [Bacteroidia bacterium]